MELEPGFFAARKSSHHPPEAGCGSRATLRLGRDWHKKSGEGSQQPAPFEHPADNWTSYSGKPKLPQIPRG